MTWKEFKEWALLSGVEDDDVIGYIDFRGVPNEARFYEKEGQPRAVSVE